MGMHLRLVGVAVVSLMLRDFLVTVATGGKHRFLRVQPDER